MTEDQELWIEGPDDLTSAVVRRRQRRTPEDQLIGCPVWWLRRIRPALSTRDQFIVAIYVWRRRIVCGQEIFNVPNGELKSWGISRYVKYRTLELLADAGLIRIVQHNTQQKRNGRGRKAPAVMILAKN